MKGSWVHDAHKPRAMATSGRLLWGYSGQGPAVRGLSSIMLELLLHAWSWGILPTGPRPSSTVLPLLL